MSEVISKHNIPEIKQEFEMLLTNLGKVLNDVKSRTNILNTKLGKIKEDLESIEKFDNKEIAKIVEIVIKFNRINDIFNTDIKFDKKELIKIIEGKYNYSNDSNEHYNDFFFEFSMAVRFLLASKGKNLKINLESDCDIIINDNIAIECKYIHSIKNLVKNIHKAKKQINKRIKDNQAKMGFIALDLSHICSRDKIEEFVDYTFNKFLHNYKYLEEKRKITDDEILESIVNNNNFKNVISSYIMNEVEIALYGEIGFSFDIGANTLAIIFQSINSFCFEYKGKIIPITTRDTTYYLNRNIDSDDKVRKVQSFISSLAVGI